jgi:hypothetical protein
MTPKNLYRPPLILLGKFWVWGLGWWVGLGFLVRVLDWVFGWGAVGGVTLDMPFGQMYSGCADYGRLHES